MQKKESNQFRTKGYYILLALCVAAVGVSGYFFVSDALREERSVQEESLSVPAAVIEQEAGQSVKGSKPQPEEKTKQSAAKTAKSVMPVPGDVVGGYSMDKLAYNATTKDWRTHGGIDLSAEAGQNVLASRAGTVMAVYEDDFYGTVVVLQHDGSYTTTYGSLQSEPPVKAGQQVTAGQIIGTVGNTARIEASQPTHLHFEVSCDGVQIDPASFLSR